MRPRSSAGLALVAVLSLCAPHPGEAQQKPLTRTFVAAAEERYQVSISIRVETHGISTEKVGEKTYANYFTREANGQMSWRSIRRVSSVAPDGTAALTETMDRFQVSCDGDLDAKTFDSALQKSVQTMCAALQDSAELNYQEEKFGFIRGLPESAGNLTGSDSLLLSLWARRAFRPSAIFPKTPLHFGERAAHRIENLSADRSKPEGEESMEWLEASEELPAAMLHVSQNLSWIDSPGNLTKNVTTRPDPRHLFYADSLNTVSMLDGSLLKASRSATQETKDTLDLVPGLPDAPVFGSKLTITATMRRLP